MVVTSVKTHKIISDDNLFQILDKYLPGISENTVVVIASKIVAITEGRIVKIGEINKDELIKKESQYYLPREENKYNVSLTITQNTLAATAGIDESNGNGYYILWPSNPQKSAEEIRKYLTQKFKIQNLGVIISDSRTTPLRWGVTGTAIGYSGFSPLLSYIGKPDIFGKNLEYTKMSLVDNLASSAALVMGEGNEQTPIAVIKDIPGIKFQDNSEEIKISIEEDLYTPILKSVRWKKGESR